MKSKPEERKLPMGFPHREHVFLMEVENHSCRVSRLFLPGRLQHTGEQAGRFFNLGC